MSTNTTREATVRLQVGTQEAEKKLENLEKKARALRVEFTKAFKEGDEEKVKKLNTEINRVDNQIRKLRTNAQNVESAMAALDKATPRQLQKVIKAINAELNSGRVQRGSKEWDAYIKKLQEAQGELSKVKEEMSGVQKAQEGMFSKFAGVFTKWWGTYTILTDAIGGVNMKLADMKKQYRDKDEARANLKALTGLDDSSIAWLTKKAETLSTTMDETGLRVTQSSKEILEAYMLVGSNKPELLTDKEALNAVTVETMRLSAAAKMGLKPAVDATTTALNQYSAGADQAAKYVNVLAAGSKFGSANVEQQAASILKAGTAAASADVPIEQLVGSIETLGEKGVKGEIAGTGLKKFFLTLQTGASSTNPKVVGLTTAVENLKKKVDEAEKKRAGGGAAFLKKMFGEEGFSIASIISSNIDKLKEYTAAVTDTDVAMEQAAINSDTLAASKAQFKNKLIETGNALIEKINPSLGILVSWQTKLIGTLPGVIDFFVKYRGTITTLALAWIVYSIQINKAIIMDKIKWLWTEKIIGSFVKLRTLAATNPWGAVIAGGALLVALLIDLTRHTDNLSRAQKSIAKIKDDAIVKLDQERIKLDLLVKIANDETASLKRRKEAIDKLNEIIPGYNGQLDETTGKYEANKKALDEYLKSLTKKYEIEGAEETLKELAREKAGLKIDERRQMKEVEAAEKELQAANEGQRPAISTTGTGSAAANAAMSASATLSGAKKSLQAIQDQIYDIENAQTEITDIWGEDIFKTNTEANGSQPQDGGGNGGGNGGGGDELTEKERKALERKRKEELKKALDQEKAIHAKSIAEITALYSTGDIDYRSFVENKDKADEDYITARKRIYEERNMEESSEYASLLKEEEEMKAKHLEKMRRMDIEDLEKNRDNATDIATSNYFDPKSSAFQNQKALNQKLLEADVEYLQGKMALYEKGSEEYMATERELEKRLASDRLSKQQETAQALLDFQKEYGKASGSIREQTELAILDNLHDQALISEEDYQKARQKIKKKYADEDKEKRKEALNESYNAVNEYDRLVDDLYVSFTMLFDNLDASSSDFFERFESAAQAAIAAVSFGLAQASSYMKACQDADIAAIENRYDKEIEAAGNNKRKIAKLEAQKEKEVAKTKKKYNDRAMKMEIAQAIAQTAANALGAYGAMVKIPVVGPALAAAAAAMATAAGMIQVATIKKQHEAQAQGYYSGGFTARHPDDRKEVGVVHANEFVANHEAVANPAIAPVLQLIDRAQKSNTVGSLTAADVTNALGRNQGVSARGESPAAGGETQNSEALALIAGVTAATRQSLDRLSSLIEDGLPTYMVMDGEQGFDRQYKRYIKSKERTKP